MFISGIGTATPPKRYTQTECWELARSAPRIRQLNSRSQALLRKVLLGDNGIEARHLALDSLDEIFEISPDRLHERFARYAPTLGGAAARRALEKTATRLADVDALIVSTCTGYLCPGLTSYISERLELREDCLLLDLVGQGCGAALPNLSTAEALLSSNRVRKVLSICVEICSAAFYLDDDPGVLVSACLFGDGAAAAVLSNEPGSPVGPSVEWVSASTLLNAKLRDSLRFEQRDGMLRNVLTKQVPQIAAEHAEHVLNNQLSASGIGREEIRGWILHAGGRTVLQAVSERLRLGTPDIAWSSAVLQEYGNLSSPCVLFVLDAALRGGAPSGWWWMSSFGAGFSCHGAILRVQQA